MTGWNLPPGCTDRDIEISQGAIVFCEQCGCDLEASALDDEESILCPRCALGDDEYDRRREAE